MKILVVEDDELLAKALVTILIDQNYAVEVAHDGDAAWDLIETYDYDLILLDVMLPKIDGINLCRQIRSQGLQMPVMLLTGCDSSHEKAIGLDAGADDYVVKPFDAEELVARVRALLRRGGTTAQPVLEWGHLRLDPSSCEVTYAQDLLSLTPKEFALLELFLRNSRRVFSCGMVLEHLWSYDDTPTEEAVRTHIKGLRQKLKAVGASGDLIETVYGIGYRLKPREETGEKAQKAQGIANLKTQQQTLTAVAGIWQQFQGRFEQQVRVLEQAVGDTTINLQLRQQATQEAHSLAGALGTFGLPVGSKLARKIEKLLRSEKTLTPNEISNLQDWVQQLRQSMQNQENIATLSSPQHQEYPVVLVIDREPILAEQLIQAASSWGLEVAVATDIQTARHQIEQQHPNIVLLDPNVSQAQQESWSLLAELSHARPHVPIVVFTEQGDFTSRLQLARNGGHTFLQKPLPVTQVLETITQVLQQHTLTEAKVLAVDDDPQILALLQSLLSPWGFKVITLDDPREFWQTLETVAPDILILDVEMPHTSGIELCQVVRSDRHWSELPVLFLTVHNDAEVLNQVFSVGADDFVSKPIVGPELVTRIINRLERMKLLKRVTQTHSHTEAEMRRVNRTLQALSSCNQILVRSKKESDLLQKICQIIVEVGGYRLVWVGFAEHDAEKTIRPVAQAGYEDGYLPSLHLTWADTVAGQSPAATAIRTGKPCIIQNIPADPNYEIWRCQASKQGYAASVALPLIVDGQTLGAVNIYAAEPDAFDAQELQLLQELAADLAYGIGALRNQRDRIKAEAALQQANNELESRVAERTAELVALNHKLQAQLDERQRIQAELRFSQAKFARILDIADDAIISIDGQQCITLFNQGAEKIFGYSAEEVVGKSLDLLLPSRFIQAHRQHVVEFGKSPNPARRMGERRELFGRRQDGTEFPAEASISKLDMGDNIFYTVILRDVTEHKQIERMKDEFVSVVSHELRTPLTSIHGSLGMLASGLLPPDSESGKRLLQIATDSTDRLVRLINDILDIERIESGRVKMERETCNLKDLIQSAVNVMQPLADQAGVQLSISSLSIQLWADQDRIVQTLTNLLSNAIKFSTRGNTVWLTAQQQEHEVLLAVKDTGRGIPQDKLDCIFERFQQVDSSDARNHEGTGLGLAICKSIIQQHGGRIWVESILGEGSTFYFTLPTLASFHPELANSIQRASSPKAGAIYAKKTDFSS